MARQHTHVFEYYQDIHERLKIQLESQAAQREAQNAKELQDFFQQLKFKINHGGDINDPIYGAIIDEIFPKGGKLSRDKFFRHHGRQGGFTFEREVARIILAVTKRVGGEATSKIKIKQAIIGNATGTTEFEQFTKQIEDELVDSYTEAVSKETAKEIDKKSSRELTSLSKVFGKIDVKGFDIGIDVKDQHLGKIYNLLKDATFSAKNYSTESWKDPSIKYNTPITMGSSDWYRSVLGALHYIDPDSSEEKLKSEIFAVLKNDGPGKNISKTTRSHLYHLKAFYEITGAGIIYSNGESYGIAKYLIYNDPSTDNIYVISTRKWVLDQIINGEDPDKIKKKIAIERAYFQN